MEQDRRFPDHVVRLTQTPWCRHALYYGRHNLTMNSFSYDPVLRAYVLRDEYTYENLHIIIRIRVNSNNLLDLFNTAYDRRFSIVGSKENFGILITRPTHTFPGAISGSNGLVRYLCQFSGTLEGIPFSSRPQKKISKQTYFSKSPVSPLPKAAKPDKEAPPYLGWFVTHPYSGGGVSPK